LIAHLFDQLQPLDLLTFEMMKQTFSTSKFDSLVNPQSNKVVCMLSARLAASDLHHNVEAFMFMRLIPVERDGRFFLTVHSEKARRIRGFGEVEPAGEWFSPDATIDFGFPHGSEYTIKI
jgi:hypothetical protein